MSLSFYHSPVIYQAFVCGMVQTCDMCLTYTCIKLTASPLGQSPGERFFPDVFPSVEVIKRSYFVFSFILHLFYGGLQLHFLQKTSYVIVRTYSLKSRKIN